MAVGSPALVFGNSLGGYGSADEVDGVDIDGRRVVKKTVGILTVIGAIVATLAIGAAPVAAQAECDVQALDYAQNPVLRISPTDVSPGDTVTIEGSGFPPGVVVPVRMNDDVIGRFSTDDAGSFTTEFVIPLGTPTGPVTFSADCGGEILASTTIRVGVAIPVGGTPPPGGELPATGSDTTGVLTRVGLALVAVGAIIAAFTRRRQPEPQNTT
ncbi:MAG: hypothetical protein KatS3mg008_0446 [Acidimicrobiales bacterium]|nr:MAG: hypothetical protein KatS3mg008_0446 [Acidimicrobiales bacterium]